MIGCTLGIVHHSFYGPLYREPGNGLIRSLEGTACDDRFGAIEVDYADRPGLAADLGRVLGQTAMVVVVSGGTAMNRGGFSLSATGEGDRKAAVNKARAVIDFAAATGASACVLPSGPDPGPAERGAALAAFSRSLCELLKYAAGVAGPGFSVTIEQMDRNFHHRHLLGPTELTVAALRPLRSDFPNLGLTFDLAHCFQLKEEPGPALAQCQDLLYQIHLGNCVLHDRQHPLYGDRHPPFGTDGGVVDEAVLARFLGLLEARGLLTPGLVVALEINTPPGHDPGLVLAAAKRVLFRAWRARSGPGTPLSQTQATEGTGQYA